jgi:riboflavin synthase
VFSGIIDRTAGIAVVAQQDGALRLSIETGYSDLALGESVAVNGVCLTVVSFTPEGCADFFVSAETLSRSNLGALAVAGLVNLERAVSLSTRLSGHLVQGHVDGQAQLVSVTPHEGAFLLKLSLPAELHGYCVEKGSICLDGISLTLNGVSALDGQGRFEIDITIIPHTWEHTSLFTRTAGDWLNVEVDVIAKYVERLCQPYLSR